jgi:hypothetical protein
MHAIRRQQIALGRPAEFAVLKVGLRGVEVRLAFENALESIGEPLVFQNDAAGDEIAALGRRVVAARVEFPTADCG